AITRFVALGLGGPGNPAGAEAVLAWQAGAPSSLSFATGTSRFLPGAVDALLSEGRADAALIVGEAPAVGLGGIPRIVIAPDATDPARGATVGLASATPGIHAGGTVMRVDGVTLPLRPALATARPTDRGWIEAIGERLDDSPR